MSNVNSNAVSNNTNVQLQRGIVKQVLSGDSIVIRGQPKGGPPPEKQINLAFLVVPKMGRKIPPSATDGKANEVIPDEPWAWEAREFVRKKVIGKEIAFKLEYKVPFSNNKDREFGQLYLDDENIAESLVREGLVEVRRRQNEESESYTRLCELEEEAKAAQRGKWGGNASEHRREVLYDVEDALKLVGKTFQGVVDFVRDGSTLRIAVQLEPMKYQMVTLMLSGIKCPMSGEPFAAEAKYFTESRLLHRDVSLRVEQISGNQNSVLIGSVTIEGKNIAEYLLKDGMAKVMSWNLGLTEDPVKLRAAEAAAKSKKLRIWKDFKESTASADSETFDAKVIEIMSADAMIIRKLDAKAQPMKIFLASVRGPPRPEGLPDRVRPLYDIPFMFEAREYLRTKLIQKKVKVRVDYTQPKSEQFPEKICCTVITSDGLNVAEGLIARGFGSVVKYRMDDDRRSSAYDALQMAELKAQKANKGIWGKKSGTGGDSNVSTIRIVDLSNDQAKAKQYQTFLLRSRTPREAVVEYVYSPSRVKVFIPKENCLLNMIIAGINTPKASEKYGPEGAAFIKNLVHQCEGVEVTLESMDKVGNYIGYLHYDGGSKNMSLELLRNGFASIRDYELPNQFKSAEADAKKKQLNIWENWTEADEQAGNDQNDEEEAEQTSKDSQVREEKPVKRDEIVITYVSSDMTSFYAQLCKKGPEFEKLLSELRDDLKENPPLPGAYQPKKGDICVAKYSLDGEWYRAKVDKSIDATQIQVLFVDYGNREVIAKKELGALPSPKYSTTSFPAAAKEYQLAFVELPADAVEEGRGTFEEDTANGVIEMKMEYRDPNTSLECVSLWKDGKDIVKGLVSEGFFMLKQQRKWDRRVLKTVDEYRSAQEEAKKKRLNIWRYGDFTEDDAREFGLPKTSN